MSSTRHTTGPTHYYVKINNRTEQPSGKLSRGKTHYFLSVNSSPMDELCNRQWKMDSLIVPIVDTRVSYNQECFLYSQSERYQLDDPPRWLLRKDEQGLWRSTGLYEQSNWKRLNHA